MTPLIDVLLVLLIIFMVIVPVTPRGLGSLLPERSRSSPEPAELPLVLEISRAPASGNAVRYRIAGRDLNLLQVRRSLREKVARSPGSAVLIDGDPALEYQAIASAVSEAHQAGYRNIGLLASSGH